MSFLELVAEMDRAALEAFGESVPVVYRPAGGGHISVSGIFDLQYLLEKGSPEAGVGVLGPAVFLRLEDLPTHPDDDTPTLTIRTVVYRVVGPSMPDGMGGVVLALRRTT